MGSRVQDMAKHPAKVYALRTVLAIIVAFYAAFLVSGWYFYYSGMEPMDTPRWFGWLGWIDLAITALCLVAFFLLGRHKEAKLREEVSQFNRDIEASGLARR